MRDQFKQAQIEALVSAIIANNPELAKRLLHNWRSVIESVEGHDYDLTLIQYLKKCCTLTRNRR